MHRRQGVAVVVVLGLMAVCLGMSYAVMRSQATSVQVQSNSQVRLRAQHAAESGLAVALRRMHESSWTGVDSVLTGTLSSTDSYTVHFDTGDAALAEQHPNAHLWPYRVTLRSTGHSVDPRSSGVAATHTCRTVVQLLPRALAARPTNWSSMLSYTVYQWGNTDVWYQVPMRVEGHVRLHGNVQAGGWYPVPTSARDRYLTDLNAMRVAGRPDFRPFDGPIDLPFTRTSSANRELMSVNLGLALNNVSVPSNPSFDTPFLATSYRLYPGGKSYLIPSLGAELQQTTLEPDPLTNPLGLFRRAGNLRVRNGVQVRGTLIVSGTLEINGTGILLQPAAAQSLEGSSQPVQLPVVVVGDDCQILSGSQATVRGLVVVADRFEILEGSSSTTLDMRGRLICQDFDVYGRTQWFGNSLVWQFWWSMFNAQVDSGTPYFPEYLRAWGLNPEPLIVIRPEQAPANYHWKNRHDPVYQPGAGDGGLRWSIVHSSTPDP